jgi:DNA-binding NarL/FixJ family response regulator
MSEDQTLCVLLVEDSPLDVFLLRAALGKVAPGPFELLQVERLEQALTLLKKRAVDLILTDLNLPDSMGPETVSALIEKAKGVPVVVLASSEEDQEFKRVGAWGNVSKNRLDSPLLNAAVQEALERKKSAS